MDAEEKFTSLEDEQLEDVTGGSTEMIITDHNPDHYMGYGGRISYYFCLDPSCYRCPNDGSEIVSKYKREIIFPIRIRRSFWWECMFCGRQFAPKSSDLVKVDASEGGGAFRSW